MRVTVEDLLYLESMSNCTLLAGKKGIMNEVSWWLFYMHTGSVLPWLHGKELIFIYGSDFEREDDQLLHFLDECVEKKVSAVVMIEGKYRKSVSDAILQKADTVNIPLIFMPDKVPFVDITRNLAEILIQDEQKKRSKNEVLRSIIFGYDGGADVYRNEFAVLGFHVKEHNYIVNMDFSFEDGSIRNAGHSILEHCIGDILYEYPYFIYEESKLVFLYSSNDTKALTLLKSLCFKLRDYVADRIKVKINKTGISCGFRDISEIKNAFHYAELAIKSIGISETVSENMLCAYDEVENIIKLLLETKDINFLKKCFDNTIGKILRYDEEHNADLLNTLQVFLRENGNIIRSAEKLNIHRNTMNYRIGRLDVVLEASVEDVATRYELKSALYFYKYYKLNRDLDEE